MQRINTEVHGAIAIFIDQHHGTLIPAIKRHWKNTPLQEVLMKGEFGKRNPIMYSMYYVCL